MKSLKFPLISTCLLMIISGCGSHAEEASSNAVTSSPAPSAQAPATPKVALGNGDANWIVVDGLRREGNTFIVPEVNIAANGWLVIHPFENGRPVGAYYSASTYVASGKNFDVPITLESSPEPGTKFLIMLHSDVNDNQVFDFVFVDEVNVLDKAVFEGATMISQTFETP